jgi:hypothetical protein
MAAPFGFAFGAAGSSRTLSERAVNNTSNVVAAFDFDGTITTRYTFLPFLGAAFGRRLMRELVPPASIALEGFVVSTVITGDSVAAGCVGASLAALFVAMWFVFPTIYKHRRR